MILCAAAGFAAGAVILKILKVLGILLLVLLGILVFLLLLILCCPISYEAAGRAEKPDYQVRGKIRLLLGILTLRAQIDEKGFRYSLKLFGLRVKRGGRKRESGEEEKSKGGAKKESGELGLDHKPSGSEPEPEKKPEETEDTETEETGEERGSVQPEKPRTAPVTAKKEAAPSDKNEKHTKDNKHTKNKKKQRSTKMRKPTPEASGKSSSAGKIKGAAAAVKRVWAELHDPTNRRMLGLVKRQVFRILRHIRPRKLRLRGVVGTGDPAQTGWILGIFYILYPLYGSAGEFELAGDFENRTLQGRFYLAGHIVPAVPLSAGIRLLLDRDIRHFVRKTFF